MANISFFFSKEKKGFATGMNAGIGNLGVTTVQFVVPVITTLGVLGTLGGHLPRFVVDGVAHQIWLQHACLLWVPLIAAPLLAACFGMNDRLARALCR